MKYSIIQVIIIFLIILFIIFVASIIIYLSLCYFYNPFTMCKQTLYTDPNSRFQINHPSSWTMERYPERVCFSDFNGQEEDQYKLDFSENYIVVQIEPSSLAKSVVHDKKVKIQINNREVEAYLNDGGGSSFSGSSVEVRIPCNLKQYRKKDFVIFVGRSWYHDDLPNPHSISPERLLKKALPIIRSFKFRGGPMELGSPLLKLQKVTGGYKKLDEVT